MDAVWIALITIAVPAIAAPIIAAWVASRNKHAEWARADELEKRQVERQATVARQVAETSRILIESSRGVREVAEVINLKVDEVHMLVNSSYTAALQAAHEAVQAKYVVLIDSAAFKKDHNEEISAEMEADIIATKKKMEDLGAAIADRLKQDAEMKEAKAHAILVGAKTPLVAKDGQPVPVTDDRTATATEGMAEALGKIADVAVKTAPK